MTLDKHLQQIAHNRTDRVFSPREVRNLLLHQGITPSIGQIQKAIKRYSLAANNSKFNCPICPPDPARTHNQAYHDELLASLQSLKNSLN